MHVFINFTNRQFWAARQFHWHEIRRQKAPVAKRFAFITTGQEASPVRGKASNGARAGPEGETSFPYGVNPVRKLPFKMC